MEAPEGELPRWFQLPALGMHKQLLQNQMVIEWYRGILLMDCVIYTSQDCVIRVTL